MDDSKFDRAARGLTGEDAFDRVARGLSSEIDLERAARLTFPLESAIDRDSRGIIGSTEVDNAIARLVREDRFDQVGTATAQIQRAYEEAMGLSLTVKQIGETLGRDGSIVQQARRASAEMQRAINLGLLPSASELALVRENLSVASAMYKQPGMQEALGILGKIKPSDIFPAEALQSQMEFAERLRESINSLTGPWARIGHEAQSLGALARLEAFGHQIELGSPFSQSVSNLLRDGMGDWRSLTIPNFGEISDPITRVEFYVETGFDEDLVDFPAEAFDEVLAIAGVGHPSLSKGIDDDQRAQIAFAILRALERRLREFIERQLVSLHAGKWMKVAVHGDLRKKWREKKDWDEKNGRQPRERLIEYADFGDLLDIVVDGKNWQGGFDAFFRDKDDFRESMRRMMPVRNATMHSSLITMEDELLLRYEAKRIFRALG